MNEIHPLRRDEITTYPKMNDSPTIEKDDICLAENNHSLRMQLQESPLNKDEYAN